MNYEIEEEIEIEETKNPKFKDLLKEYKELDIEIKEKKLKQEKLKVDIFNLMEDEEIKKFSNDFGTAYYSEKFTFNEKEAIEYFKEHNPELLIQEYKLREDAKIKIQFNDEYDFGKTTKLSKNIRTK